MRFGARSRMWRDRFIVRRLEDQGTTQRFLRSPSRSGLKAAIPVAVSECTPASWRKPRRLLWIGLLGLCLAPVLAYGHIGTQNVVLESSQPPNPVRVIIRPPGVVPGLADIDVRVLTNGVRRVTVLPVHWRAGLAGAPPPDLARPVPGDNELYHAQLWLMARGAYSVHVKVETAHGTNTVIVPVNSLATTRLGMTNNLVGVLIGLGLLLFALGISIVGAAVRESILKPGVTASPRRVWWGRASVGIAGVLLALALERGHAWWKAEDADYRHNGLHQPVACQGVVVNEGNQRLLRINIQTNEGRASWSSLVPDHGKLMHVFLMREPQLDVLAHLHPARRSRVQFEAVLPPMPAGDYRLYADVTHETAFSQTLTTLAQVPSIPVPPGSPAGSGVAADPDDSWFQGRPVEGGNESQMGGGWIMKWERPPSLGVRRETTLRFQVLQPDGGLARLEPYVGMLGHAAIRREDGSVFTHLHPAGSVSLAAQQVFQIRAGDHAPKRITPEMMEKYCLPPTGDSLQQPLSFPYEFPQPGRYLIWVQVKAAGQARTGVFAGTVENSSK